MARPPILRIGLEPEELIVDSFAGGGGASEGIRFALGRDPDIAINHDAEAIALHAANHPDTRHLIENVWKVDPVAATNGRRVGLAWFSPDCKHFSKAKGGKPVSKKIRGLAWVVVRWCAAFPEGKRPRMIFLENVEEFQGWGPVLADGKPCPVRKGKTFRAFIRKLERLGYQVSWKELRACDYGAPTIRKRLFLIARCDGQPIVWPKPTHGKFGQLPWRTAAECIDFSLPCPSIFTRKKPLAENTLRRIARGLNRFVINAPKPFIVNMAHGGKEESLGTPLSTIATEKGGCRALIAPTLARTAHGEVDRHGKKRGQNDPDILEPMATVTASGDVSLVGAALISVNRPKNHGTDDLTEPFRTVTAAPRGEQAIAGATLIQMGYGEREGQAPRCLDPEKPLGTLVGYRKHALAAAFLAQHNTGNAGHELELPLSTIVGGGPVQGVVASHLTQFNGTSDGQPTDKPLPSITAQGWKFAEVRAFLCAYFGNEKDGASLFDPMRTVTSKDRFGLVTVEGVDYEIADIGMRMLAPRELFNAQGFRRDYIIDLAFNGKPLTKTAQVRMVGNSVCPPMAAALIAANCRQHAAEVAA